MSQFHGSNGLVKIGSNTVAELKSIDYNETAVVRQTNEPTMNDSAPALTYQAGETSWEGSMTCLWDDTDTTGQGAMTIGASVTVNFLPEGATTGDAQDSGTAIIKGVGVASSFDGMVQRTFQVQGSGAMTHGTAA